MVSKALLSTLLLISAFTIRVEINNIHNGYKLSLEGKGVPQDDSILILQPNFIENTLLATQENSQLFQIYEDGLRVQIGELVPIMPIGEDFDTMILTTWSQLSEITVGFNLDKDFQQEGEDSEAIYSLIRDKSLPPNEDF